MKTCLVAICIKIFKVIIISEQKKKKKEKVLRCEQNPTVNSFFELEKNNLK